MSSLTRVATNAASGSPRREYIATSAFNNDLWTYTVALNSKLVSVGTLSLLSTATAALCPANRVLRETGRRLIPGANPGINTLMVGVYDSVSGLNGLIDPNSPRFAVYSCDRSVYMDYGWDRDPSTGLQDKGPPVYTNGTVTAGSGVVATAGGVVATAGQVRAATVTVLTPGATINIDPTLGQVFTLAQGSAVAVSLTCTTTPVAGSLVYVVITQAGTAAAVTGGANVKMASVLPTQSKTTTVAFISDGVNLNQFGSAISA